MGYSSVFHEKANLKNYWFLCCSQMGGIIGGALVIYSFTDCMLKHKEDYMTDDEDEIWLGGSSLTP